MTGIKVQILNDWPMANIFFLKHRINGIVKKLLLAGDKFMSEMYLRQPGFGYNPNGPFTRNKEAIKAFKKAGDSSYIYQNELDNACNEHDMAYGDFKDLLGRTTADKVLRHKVFNIVKNPIHDRYQGGLSMDINGYQFKIRN